MRGPPRTISALACCSRLLEDERDRAFEPRLTVLRVAVLLYCGPTDEPALNDKDCRLIVIHEDGVNLLIVSPVGYIVACLHGVAEGDIPKIPCDKTLPVIGETLLREY